MSGWAFIMASAACSVTIGHFLKLAEQKKLRTEHVLLINYAVAAVAAFALSAQPLQQLQWVAGRPLVILFAALIGVIFIANFYVYSKSVHLNGLGVSVAAMRISLIVPIIVSVFWYLDSASASQWTGVLLVFVALFLLLPEKRSMLREPTNVAWLLVLLVIGTGLGDASLKVFEEDLSARVSSQFFMGMVFTFSLLTGVLISLFRERHRFAAAESWIGIAVGIPNLFSALFLIAALEQMSGAIVYSAVNMLTVIGAALLGFFYWKDSLTRLQWAGIAVTVICILLLVE
ncbi:MAG: hypothetical protein ACNA78_05530 [Balneolaceae bacterium]